MKKHRVAVIGCGALAQEAHLPNCQRNPRVELVATCDTSAATARKCQMQFGAQRMETDWRKVVAAPDVDLCILATHHDFRGEFIIPALEAGKAVYTEKPLAPDRREMAEIVRVTRRTGGAVCVGHNRRSSPAAMEFKRLLDKARQTVCSLAPSLDRSAERTALPEEKMFQLLLRVNDDIRSWKSWGYTDQEGILFSEMVHFIDLALWFNDSHPVRVFAEGSCRGNFALVLRFGDGSVTTLHHSMVGHFDYPKELIEATLNNVTLALEQHLEVRQFGLIDEPVQQFFPVSDSAGKMLETGMNGYMQALETELCRNRGTGQRMRRIQVNKGHAAHLDRFLSYLEDKGENPCDIDSAVSVNLITLKLLDSIRLGLPVAINPEDWHLAS